MVFPLFIDKLMDILICGAPVRVMPGIDNGIVYFHIEVHYLFPFHIGQ